MLFVVASIVWSLLSARFWRLLLRLLLDRRCRRWAGIISPWHDAPREGIGGDLVVFVCV
jgi:hypothetical protein